MPIGYEAKTDRELLLVVAERTDALPEIKDRLKSINGNILDHATRLATIEARCLERQRIGEPLLSLTMSKKKTAGVVTGLLGLIATVDYIIQNIPNWVG